MQAFVMFHEPGPDWLPGVPYPQQPGLEAHVVFLRTLLEDGQLLMGGPFVDDAQGGMQIIQAKSLGDAIELAHQDPSVGRLLEVTVRPWLIGLSRFELGAD